jgi:hypothetical protein
LMFESPTTAWLWNELDARQGQQPKKFFHSPATDDPLDHGHHLKLNNRQVVSQNVSGTTSATPRLWATEKLSHRRSTGQLGGAGRPSALESVSAGVPRNTFTRSALDDPPTWVTL